MCETKQNLVYINIQNVARRKFVIIPELQNLPHKISIKISPQMIFLKGFFLEKIFKEELRGTKKWNEFKF